jgi:hypothetical protein
MRYTFDIDTTEMVVATLKEDYANLNKEIDRLKAIEPPKQFHIEDLEDTRRFLDAMTTIFYYYLPSDKADEITKKRLT